MRKIISLFMVAVVFVLCLVSCEGGPSNENYDGKYNPEKTKEISLNMYIIYDDGSTQNALTSVATEIADYTEEKFKTKVNVIYKTASEYEEAVKTAVTSQDDGIKAGIVLINSEGLMDELMADEVLLDLTSMYATKQYGTLKKQINSALLEASEFSGKKLYSVPNNRVLGEYTYLLINKALARGGSDFSSSETDWKNIKTLADAENMLPDGSYETVVGSYNTRFEYDTDVYYFNESIDSLPIIEYPSVTREDAFASAFAVVAGGAIPKTAADSMNDTEFVSRAMQIIYAINTDSKLRNLLQYGREMTNYYVAPGECDENGVEDANGKYARYEDSTTELGYVIVPAGTVIPRVGTDSYYKMNLEYTGDVFIAAPSYYPEENYGWSAEDCNDGKKQNEDVVFVNPTTLI